MLSGDQHKFASNKQKLLNMEMENKIYWRAVYLNIFFSLHVSFHYSAFWNLSEKGIPVTNGKELIVSCNKMCAAYFNGLL